MIIGSLLFHPNLLGYKCNNFIVDGKLELNLILLSQTINFEIWEIFILKINDPL